MVLPDSTQPLRFKKLQHAEVPLTPLEGPYCLAGFLNAAFLPAPFRFEK